MSLPFRVFFFFWGGPGGSPGSACGLPRPHDDIDADADADAAAAADDDDDDDDDQCCGSALRLRASDGVEPQFLLQVRFPVHYCMHVQPV